METQATKENVFTEYAVALGWIWFCEVRDWNWWALYKNDGWMKGDRYGCFARWKYHFPMAGCLGSMGWLSKIRWAQGLDHQIKCNLAEARQRRREEQDALRRATDSSVRFRCHPGRSRKEDVALPFLMWFSRLRMWTQWGWVQNQKGFKVWIMLIWHQHSQHWRKMHVYKPNCQKCLVNLLVCVGTLFCVRLGVHWGHWVSTQDICSSAVLSWHRLQEFEFYFMDAMCPNWNG